MHYVLICFFWQAVQNYFDENGQYFGQQPSSASSRKQAVERTLDIELEVINEVIKSESYLIIY